MVARHVSRGQTDLDEGDECGAEEDEAGVDGDPDEQRQHDARPAAAVVQH